MSSELSVELDGTRVEWDVERLRSLLSGDGESPWQLDGDPDWSRVEALRIVSAAFEDGAVLGVAALRPAGAEGHDAEAVRGALVEPGGEVRQLHEVLISVELGPAGAARRLGLELYVNDDSLPIRVAADGEGQMQFRMEGTAGAGRYEVLTGG